MATFNLQNGTVNNFEDSFFSTRVAADVVNVLREASTYARTTLVINSDPQWGKHAQPIGNVMQTSGNAEIRIDARDVRWFAYDGGSGNFPSIQAGASLKRAGVTLGEVIGIWTSFPAKSPAVYGTVGAGTAAAATGWIKVRSLSSAVADNDALTIEDGTNTMNLTANGADQVGWLSVLAYLSYGMLNKPLCDVKLHGQWWEVGTSNGAASQTMTWYSSHDYLAGVWVETGSGTDVFEFWPNIGSSTLASFAAGEAGKVISVSGQTITFGNGTNGTIPPNGAKVRVPNLTVGNTSAALWATQDRTVDPTYYTNYKLESQAGGGNNGLTLIDKVNCSWHVALGRCEASVDYLGTGGRISVSRIGQPMTLNRIGCGQALTHTYGQFYVDYCSANVTVQDLTALNVYSTNESIEARLNNGKVTFGKVKSWGRRGANGNTGQPSSLNVVYNTDVEINNPTIIGGKINLSSNAKVRINNIVYSDSTSGSTSTVASHIVRASGDFDLVVDGLSLMPGGIAPYETIFYPSENTRLKIRNVGSLASPFDCQNRTGDIFRDYQQSIGQVDRAYFTNLRTTIHTLNDSSKGWRFQNVADLSQKIFYASFGQDFVYRGMRAGSNTSGQLIASSASLNRIDVLDGESNGIGMFDVFASDTLGAVIVMAQGNGNKTLYTITAGSPVVEGDGRVLLRNVGDEIVWHCDYWIKGHTGFQASGALETVSTNAVNMAFEYRLDTGSGWGAWKTASDANLSAETISPSAGFKVEMRARCVTASSINQVTAMALKTTTTLAAQSDPSALYPLGQFQLTVENVVVGSRLRLEKVSDGSELTSAVAAASTVVLTVPVDGSDFSARLKVRKSSEEPYYRPYETIVTVTDGVQSVYVSQTPD